MFSLLMYSFYFFIGVVFKNTKKKTVGDFFKCIALHLYQDTWKADFIKNERKKLMSYKAELVKTLEPRIFCPFAGYFVEAHPLDR